ncbi:unnamed protein product [Orchesella dallaii]|uniref:Fucosyltransferase n=1 Tax=Orchesella dallaii TaxID=48710 RepID=A0ABP1RVG8_9HEXA
MGRKDLESFSGIFNWTMTYRRDSDIFHPYGRIIKTENGEESQDFLSKKTKFAAGVISNCFADSKREVLIEQLKNEGLQIDIFGKCGIPICPHGVRANQNCTETDFWKMLARDYKFYLAFENALCLDYVTEKFFRTLELGLVPVVYGGADYDEIAPPNSFVNVESFESPKELAKFLIELDAKPKEYKKYFEWRKTHKVVKGIGACDLCEKIRKHNLERSQGKVHVPKVYSNLQKWWTHYPFPFEEKEACRRPTKYE